MFGNCETGKLTIVMAPTITVRMAITIATMGRLMKKLDMDTDSFQSNCAIQLSLLIRFRGLVSFSYKWLGLHGHARAEILLAFRDDTFAGPQSFLNNPHSVDAVSNFDRADGNLAVLPDNVSLIAALQLCDSKLRHQQCAFLDPNHGANFPVLPGTQYIAGIGKERRQLNRARVLIHRAAREVEGALVRIRCSVSENELQFPALLVRT